MITNKTNGKVLCRDEKHCKSWFSQGLGLMFSSKKNVFMVFAHERKVSLHNCFVFYPINLVFLDKDKKVVEIKKDFKPFTFYTSTQKAQYLLETPFDLDVKVGDMFSFKE